KTATFTVTYQIPCNPPVIAITSGTSVTTNAYAFTATVANVQNQNDIVVKLNNQAVPFTFSNGAVSANLTLIAGANNITIDVVGCENKSASATVTYNEPAQDCMPEVSGIFSSDNLSATANSTKDLSNVVLHFHDGVHQKFEGLSGLSMTFSGTGNNLGKC